ncbi:MAG: hypothetical protein UY61_C0059G0003 [Candidatus Adlerbacteria bacterium GW2011_GWC1_50_9]|uniref:Uncharacterized protein n=1 Tax=Candidatus Adlerbacteria bacterium GW2011_GWC1_50_9 TaxID=1618608 RepID=A0A0G1YWH4_9BACT|nr:MAG: hypothetical protein UY61_C0059G0003 [Candidatus Adlerbacteria bacterium GW2011_GWC1_50_9]
MFKNISRRDPQGDPASCYYRTPRCEGLPRTIRGINPLAWACAPLCGEALFTVRPQGTVLSSGADLGRGDEMGARRLLGRELHRLPADPCHVRCPPIRSDEALSAVPRLRSQRTVAAEARVQAGTILDGNRTDRTVVAAEPISRWCGVPSKTENSAGVSYAQPQLGLGRSALAA